MKQIRRCFTFYELRKTGLAAIDSDMRFLNLPACGYEDQSLIDFIIHPSAVVEGTEFPDPYFFRNVIRRKLDDWNTLKISLFLPLWTGFSDPDNGLDRRRFGSRVLIMDCVGFIKVDGAVRIEPSLAFLLT